MIRAREAVRDMLRKGTTSIAQIAKATGVKRPTVYRLKDDPVSAEGALAAWGL
jgi:putative DNA-invertase from lambdoid prophage Rac